MSTTIKYIQDYLVPHFRQTRKQGETTVPCVLFLDNASSHAPRLADVCLGHVVTAGDRIPRVDCDVKAPPCDALSDAEALERRKAFQARCAACVDLVFVELRIRWLPPNTTSLIQPCDHALIARLKALWRKHARRTALSRTSTI